MDQNLRGLFERALDAEPVPPGDLAQEAMMRGTRLRRRRSLLAGGGAAGVVAVFATVVALNMTAPTGETIPLVAPAAMRLPVNAACTWPVHRAATDVSIFLRTDITNQQRLDLNTTLQADPLVRSVRFESREQAYAKYMALWEDTPDLVQAVTADQMPESFRVKLAEPSQYTTFVAGLKNMRGIDEIIGSMCPQGSGEGE